MKCSKQKQHELLVAIGKGINLSNWALVEQLGKELKSYEEPVYRVVKSLGDYPVFKHESKLSKLTTTVYRVNALEFGENVWYTTLREIARRKQISALEAYQWLTENNYTIEPIAEVFSECVDKIVYIYHNGKQVDCGFYLDVAYTYNIHFEDLNDVIEERLPIIYEGTKYFFKYIDSK